MIQPHVIDIGEFGDTNSGFGSDFGDVDTLFARPHGAAMNSHGIAIS